MYGEKYSDSFDWHGNRDVTMDMEDSSDDDLNITASVTKDLKTKVHRDSESLWSRSLVGGKLINNR